MFGPSFRGVLNTLNDGSHPPSFEGIFERRPPLDTLPPSLPFSSAKFWLVQMNSPCQTKLEDHSPRNELSNKYSFDIFLFYYDCFFSFTKHRFFTEHQVLYSTHVKIVN